MAEQVGLLYHFNINTCQNVALEEMVSLLILEATNGAFFWCIEWGIIWGITSPTLLGVVLVIFGSGTYVV